jgi:DNA ligase-1
MLASPVETPEEAIARFTTKPDTSTPDSTLLPTAHIAAFLEDKYDGMRAQLHFGDPAQPARVALYSRNREDITESYPELIEAFTAAIADHPHTGPTVLDGEILGWDFTHPTADLADPDETDPVPHASQPHRDAWENEPLPIPSTLTDTARVPHASQPHRDAWERRPLVLPHPGRALPFAVLGQRIGRKRVANDLRTRVPVIFMAFDLLVHNGELILHLPLSDRRARLEALTAQLAPQAVAPLQLDPHATAAQSSLFASESPASPAHARLLLSPARLVQSAEDIDQAYAAARARSNEGVMIKAAASHYQPGRRGLAWVKLKRELATLDVVITGAEFGHGRRAGTLSDYTFAVRRGHSTPTSPVPHASRSDAWETDTAPDSTGDPADLLNVGKAYSGLTDSEIAELSTFLKAHTLEDHGHFRTVEPLVVLEVAFNNIMRSTRHASGFALRFPRILRLRPDKPLAEIDTLARVEAIYTSQIDKPAEE